ncbi:MAG: proline dehydrogenase family protein, partial [Bacteroidota bacterium]
PNKPSTDRDYDAVIALALQHLDVVEVSAATHNEESTLRVVERMQQQGIANTDSRVWFSQLYGMSDYMSYNLANSGYNVAKYLPYGPVRATVPYLIRRAQENTAIAGQMGKELKLIVKEKKRRRQAN